MQWAEREFVGRDFSSWGPSRDDDLSRLRTERVVFTECDFSGVNLAESEHLGSAFRNCTFKLTGSTKESRGTALFASAACWVRYSSGAGCGR